MTFARHLLTASTAAAAWCALALVPQHVLGQVAQVNACGPLGAPLVASGPYDYQTDRKMVTFIEGNHFQPQVEALVGGVSGTVGAELNFMLLHIPNHPRVLLALVRYGEKLKWVSPPGLQFPYECYFDRAIRFRPDDAMVRMIYATYLNKFSRTSDALSQLAYASNVAKDDAFAHYNVGLIYLDMKQYDLALAEAHKALSLGFPRPELRDRLKAAGKWREPATQTNEPKVEESKP
jgi:hypothetical protein